MSRIILAVLAVALMGCAGVRSSSYGPVTTQFISSPPGARIEIDGNYVGDAPLSYRWPQGYQNGARFRDQVTIKAFPAGAGRPQRKFYESFSGVLPPIPAKVYFDMTAAAEKADEDEDE